MIYAVESVSTQRVGRIYYITMEDMEQELKPETELTQDGDNAVPVISEDAANDAPPETDAKKDKKPRKKPSFDRHVALRWSLMTLGTVLMSVSVYFFQVPNDFTIGGVAGLAIVLSQFTPLSQAIWMAIFNVALLVVGLIILGRHCTIRTVYCSLLYTGLIALLEAVVPLDGPLTDQPLLELVYAILLVGFGGALLFNCGSSSGGTDIVALILKKYTRINVGMALLVIDLLIVCVSIFAFDSIKIALYSFLGLFAKSFLLDGVIESIGKTKHITIITTKPEEIGQFILNVVKHGYTVYDAEGGYTHEPKKVMITVCKRSEALKLKMKVKDYDKDAFVIITDANEILGKGFGGTI